MVKVFLSAGHGGYDPGAIGNGLLEKDINLEIMKACADVLTANGVSVECSRYSDEDDPVGEEVAEANASGASVAVSFHTNAGGGDGSETYYWTSSLEGQRLATLCEEAAMSVGQNSRGIKSGDHLWWINSTLMTAVLCECAFIDTDDISIVDEKSEQIKLGQAYAKAILTFLGIEEKVFEPEDAPEVPEAVSESFLVKVDIPDLNIRKGPGTDYARTGIFTGKGVFTIVSTSEGIGSDAGWGELKSGAGWIALDFAERL